MVRLSILLLLSLSACRPDPSALSPDDAVRAHIDALRQGDAAHALALLTDAADAGHLEALRVLADARQQGYLRVPYDPATKSATLLPIRTTRWKTGRALRRYERALEDAARAGRAEALFHVADRLLEPRRIHGAHVTVNTDLDSARAIYRTLADRGADPLRLAFLADRLGDEAGHLAHLDTAAEEGDPNACVFRYWARRDRGDRFTAAGVARQIDALETCRDRAIEADRTVEMFTSGERVVGDLAEQAGRGNAEAMAVLDSLRADGVFERHPRLAPHAEAATRG